MTVRFESERDFKDMLKRNPDVKVEGQTDEGTDSNTVSDLNAYFGKPETEGISWQQWQDKVINLLRDNGWMARIIRPARTNKGWRTPIQGDEGEPDILAVHPDKLLIWWIECKVGRGSLTAKQEKWVMALSKCQVVNPNVRMFILRPDDFESFEKAVREVNDAG
jgi:hypothetical protein